MQTLFRATVMLAIIAAIGWAVLEYGAAGAVRPITTKAIELADRLIGRPGALHNGQTPFDQPPAVIGLANSQPAQLQLVASLSSTQNRSAPAAPALLPRYQQIASPPSTLTLGVKTGSDGPLAELRALGARDISTTPWGRDGILHRVCCEVPLGDGMARHFEAVAEDPITAARAVLAETRAWQVQ